MVGDTRPSAPVEVRAAEPGELDAIVAVALAGARSDLAWAGSDWIPPDPGTTRRLWWERLRDQHTWVGTALSAFTCVGCATLWPASAAVGRVAYFVGPIVDPEWWGEGIGRLLLDESVAVADRRGFSRMEVAVLAGNRRGRRFLERAGWTETPDPRPQTPTALVVYGRQLTIENRSQYAA